MKGILVDPERNSISEIDIGNDTDIASVIGYDTIIADEINNSSDRLHFDEECFIRGTKGRFQLDTLPPVSGKAIILGTSEDRNTDAALSIAELESRIKFLT